MSSTATPSPSASGGATVCAVVVTFNRLALLKECIAALRAQTRPLDRILVVNNGSTDGTAEWLDGEPDLLIVHQGNLGGAGGFSTGIERASGEKHDWIWCMDDDVAPDRDCLAQLLSAGQIVPEAGVLTPVRISPDGTLSGPEKLLFNFTNPFLPYGHPRLEDAYASVAAMGERPVRVEGVTFEGPMFKRSVIEQIGLPRRDFFIFLDDADYCLRASRETSIYMVPQARINRRLVQPAVSQASWRDYYYVRNVVLLDLEYGSWIVKLIRPLKFSLGYLKGKIHNHRVEKPLLQTWWVLRGLIHGYLGLTGKRH